jgi:hypothetical protein
MIYTAVILVIILMSIAVCFGVGARLPAQHVAQMSSHYPIGCEALWLIITDYVGALQWRSSLTRVHRDTTTAREVWVEHYGRRKIAYETIEQHPYRSLARKIATPGLPYSGTWRFEIVPAQDGCVLQITESGAVPNPMFRFVSHYFIGPERSLRQYLTELSSYVANCPDHSAQDRTVS